MTRIGFDLYPEEGYVFAPEAFIDQIDKQIILWLDHRTGARTDAKIVSIEVARDGLSAHITLETLK